MSRIDYTKLAQSIEENHKKDSKPNFLTIRGYENTIEYYKGQIATLNDEIKALQSQLTFKESKINEQERIIEIRSNNLEKEKHKLNLTICEINRLNAEVGRLRGQLNFSSENERFIQEKLNSGLKEKNLALQNLDRATRRIEAIQSELTKALDAKKIVESQLNSMSQQKYKILQELKEKTNQLPSKDQLIAELTHSNEKYIKHIQKIEQEYAALKEKYELSEQKNSGLDQLEEESEKVKQQLKQRNREMSQLKSNNKVQQNLLEGQQIKNKAQEEKLIKLEKNLQQKNKEIQELKKNLREKDKGIQNLKPISKTAPRQTQSPLSENLTSFLETKLPQGELKQSIDFAFYADSLKFKQYIVEYFIIKASMETSIEEFQSLEKNFLREQYTCARLLDLYIPVLKHMFSKDKDKGKDKAQKAKGKLLDKIDFENLQFMYPAFSSYIWALAVIIQIRGTANELQKSELVEHLQVAASPSGLDTGLPPAQYALALMYDPDVSLTLVSVESNQSEANKYYKMAEKHGFLSIVEKNKLTESTKDESQILESSLR